MSHLHQRKQKDCLNCNATVVGRYCHICGQENIEPKESVWHLISHFFNDVTHFDGKFFVSMKDIILRPGFLSKEYMIGKRATYLNPIRMYLFTSFIFFLIFFSLYKSEDSIIYNQQQVNHAVNNMDSSDIKNISEEFNNGKPLSKKEINQKLNKGNYIIIGDNYKSKEEFDSVMKASPNKYGWLSKMLIYKGFDIKKKYGNDDKQIFAKITEKIEHSIPQMLFVLLPLFALLLKLLYIRRKEFYYTNHAIFTIHFYVFIFLALLFIFSINKIEDVTKATWLNYLIGVLVLSIFFYLYKAMRNFYKQSIGKTILKYIILVSSFLIICIIAFAALTTISVFEI